MKLQNKETLFFEEKQPFLIQLEDAKALTQGHDIDTAYHIGCRPSLLWPRSKVWFITAELVMETQISPA